MITNNVDWASEVQTAVLAMKAIIAPRIVIIEGIKEVVR